MCYIRCTLIVGILLAMASLAGAQDQRSRTVERFLNGPEPLPVDDIDDDQIVAAIRRGNDFLLARQNKNGSWGSPTNTKGLNIYAPVPGAHHAFRGGVTGLVISALIESQDRRPEVVEAIDRGEAWMEEWLPRIRRAEPTAIYNVWAHAYAIRALVDLHGLRAGDAAQQEKLRDLTRQQLQMLERYAGVNGGWGYYDFGAQTQKPNVEPTSFTTATVLIAIKEAEQLGLEFPEKIRDYAILSLKRQQKPDFSYFYSDNGPTMNRPMWEINRPGGSLGRSQACNLAMRLWGDTGITDEVLETWLDRLFARNLWLDIGRKRPIPHESHFLVAGYFFYYGHFYASQCIDQLPVDARSEHQDQLAAILLKLQEKDGSWWDFPFYDYHQQYGTAMAIMSLQRCLSPSVTTAVAQSSVADADASEGEANAP